MSGNYKLRFADFMPKKICTAYKKGKGVRVHLFKNAPGGTVYDCNLSHTQVKRYNKLKDGKQKLYFNHADLSRNHRGGVSISYFFSFFLSAHHKIPSKNIPSTPSLLFKKNIILKLHKKIFNS